MADLLRMLTLDGQMVGAGMLVALVWLVIAVRGIDTKVTALDPKVTGIANTVADPDVVDMGGSARAPHGDEAPRARQGGVTVRA